MSVRGSLQVAVEYAASGLADQGAPVVWPVERLLVAGLLGAMALALATLAAASLIRRDKARHGPTCRRLCRAIGINAAHRRLLEGIAHSAGGLSAASLLISRGCFDQAAKRYATAPGQARQLAAIRRAVFDDAGSDEATPPQ